jgi:hypothetical protein
MKWPSSVRKKALELCETVGVMEVSRQLCVPAGTISRWRHEQKHGKRRRGKRREKRRSAGGALVEVAHTGEVLPVSGAPALQLGFGAGATLTFAQLPDPSYLQVLMTHAARGCP